MGKLSRKKIVVISSIILAFLVVLGFKMLKPSPLDENGYYYKNSLGIYTNHKEFLGNPDVCIPTELEDADPYDFSLIHIEWSTDDEDVPRYAYAQSNGNIYFKSKVIKDMDIESFEHLGGGYSKDSENIFYHEAKVEGVDTGSFEFLGDSIAVDANGFYYQSHPVLKKTGNQTFVLFMPEETEVITNDKGIIFLQDSSGAYKVGEKIKVQDMDGEYHQAQKSDKSALTVFMTENMTVYSTHILY
jgi:hypothetical protein